MGVAAPPAANPYVAAAEAYARGVVDGSVLACKWVRLSCAKLVEVLERQDEEDFPYRVDGNAAARVCGCLELFPHVKGKWARARERLRLEPWQAFIVVSVFGVLRKSDGLRRYRGAYIEVPRKNAKSTLTAGLGLHMLARDGEFGAEVYSGATTEKQAWEVFGPARLMALKTPDFCQRYGIQVGAKNLHTVRTGSKFEPIVGQPGDGASPSFSITDEYHEHPTSRQYDTMTTGMGAREQPIAWVITTAGENTAGPCYALRAQALAMLDGSVPDDELFAIIYTIDDDDDWTSEEALRKANPNYDVSVRGEYLRRGQRKAVANPREQATFKTKHLNIWVGAASPYFNLEKWDRLADPSLEPSQFAGEGCWIGIDLASKLDLTAKVKVFARLEEDGQLHYYAFLDAYLPDARAEDPALRHYAAWREEGYLTTTPGNVTDYDYIETDAREDAELHHVVELGFDPYNATQVATHLMGYGIPCVEIPQTVKHLSDPMKWVEALIVDGRIHHDGNPVFSWAIGNVTAQVDRNDNVFPRKESQEKKIDPAVALIIALGRALAEAPEPGVHVLEDSPPRKDEPLPFSDPSDILEEDVDPWHF